MLTELIKLKPLMVAAAQMVYDNWRQDAYGLDWHYGSGGICDDISEAIGGIIVDNIANTQVQTVGDAGDHCWTVVNNEWTVDIAYQHYERGYGYVWTKIEGVTFTTDMIDIWRI